MPIQQRLLATVSLAVVIAVSSALAGSPAFGAQLAGSKVAATLCVGVKPGCFATVQAALDAAHDGDIVQLGPGSYPGGLTIRSSIKLTGAGAAATVISGGGPVLTIGTSGAASEPTVQISGVTISGGVSRTSPVSIPFVGQDGVIATGAGVEIVPNANFTGGATVTIANSVISGNRVAPTATLAIGPPCPDGRPCPFAFAGGGGVDSWGPLTLVNTTVSNNKIGSASGLSALASDAEGGAILTRGPLTVVNSEIRGNQSSATAPNGRFAEAGAIMTFGPSLTITNSTLTGNSATLNAALPESVEMLVNGGAIHLTGPVAAATIANTTISGNTATMTNTVGAASAFSAGVLVESVDTDFEMSNSTLANNTVVVSAQGAAEGDSGAGEFVGTISNSRVIGNTVTVHSDSADATAAAGGMIQRGSLTNSVVSGNHVHGSAPLGPVTAEAGGILVDDTGLTVRNTAVAGNTATASGQSGEARGAGIFDGSVFGFISGGPLTLQNSTITANTLSGSPGITVQGGGLYLENNPFSSLHSLIATNTPDQCFGC